VILPLAIQVARIVARWAAAVGRDFSEVGAERQRPRDHGGKLFRAMYPGNGRWSVILRTEHFRRVLNPRLSCSGTPKISYR